MGITVQHCTWQNVLLDRNNFKLAFHNTELLLNFFFTFYCSFETEVVPV